LVRQYGRYGYRKIAELLRRAGWLVNDKRVERIWRREGLKVPAKQPKRGRLWLNDGSCIRLRAERPNHVWSYDFVEERTHDGRKFRMLNIIDEFTHSLFSCRSSDPSRYLDRLFAACLAGARTSHAGCLRQCQRARTPRAPRHDLRMPSSGLLPPLKKVQEKRSRCVARRPCAGPSSATCLVGMFSIASSMMVVNSRLLLRFTSRTSTSRPGFQ